MARIPSHAEVKSLASQLLAINVLSEDQYNRIVEHDPTDSDFALAFRKAALTEGPARLTLIETLVGPSLNPVAAATADSTAPRDASSKASRPLLITACCVLGAGFLLWFVFSGDSTSGTSGSAPSEADARAVIEQIPSVQRGEVRIVNVTKTNGQASEDGGVRRYQMNVAVDFECVNPPYDMSVSGFDPIQCESRRDVGRTITSEGAIDFDMTEQGWRGEAKGMGNWTRRN